MPRPRRRSRARTGLSRLSLHQAESLLKSELFDDILASWPGNQHSVWPGGAEQRREAWELHRDALLQYWTQEPPGDVFPACLTSTADGPAGPFLRPHAWWQFEDPPDRLCLGCGSLFPLWRTVGGHGSKEDSDCRCSEPLRESMAAFLQRIGALLPWEKPTPKDLEPEFPEWRQSHKKIFHRTAVKRQDGRWELVEVEQPYSQDLSIQARVYCDSPRNIHDGILPNSTTVRAPRVAVSA